MWLRKRKKWAIISIFWVLSDCSSEENGKTYKAKQVRAGEVQIKIKSGLSETKEHFTRKSKSSYTIHHRQEGKQRINENWLWSRWIQGWKKIAKSKCLTLIFTEDMSDIFTLKFSLEGERSEIVDQTPSNS